MEGLGACCVLVMGLLFFLAWTAGIFAIRPKHFYSLWIGVPVLGLIALICVGFAISFYQSLPSVVFRDSAGFDPTPDVTIVHSLRHMPADWDDSYLVFYASDSTIDKILDDGFARIKPKDIIDYGEPAVWWTPPTSLSVRIYATNTDDPDFRSELFRFFVRHRLLIYDPGSGAPGKRKVYFRYRRP